MQVFIDANIYLDYFRRNETKALESLRALKKLLSNGKLLLLVPEQTKEEYLRLHGQIVEETRKQLLVHQKRHEKMVLPTTYLTKWAEAKQLKKACQKVSQIYDELIRKYDDRTDKDDTEADKLLNKIFKLAKDIVTSDALLQRAHTRYLKGNPPRKSNYSYGDAVIWEALLEQASDDDLVIITRDTDFIEERKGKKVLKAFLAREWKLKSKENIQLFVSLAEFINDYSGKEVVDIEVVEDEKLAVAAGPLYSSEMVGGAPGSIAVSSAGQFNFYDPNVGTAVFRNNVLRSDVLSAATFTGEYDGAASILGHVGPNTIRFCPYCGEKLDEIESDTIPSYLYFGSTVCKKCGRKVTL